MWPNVQSPDEFGDHTKNKVNITLWLFNIAMDNCPFIDDFPIKTSIYKGFSMAMLNNQMVTHLSISCGMIIKKMVLTVTGLVMSLESGLPCGATATTAKATTRDSQVVQGGDRGFQCEVPWPKTFGIRGFGEVIPCAG